MEHVDRILLVKHRVRNRKQPHVRWLAESTVEVLRGNVRLETLPPRVDLPDGLLQRLLEGTPDSHDLAN